MRPEVAVLPATPGVYRFVDERGRTLYVGRAVDLRRRVASYWGRLRDRPRLRRMVRRITRVDALVCASAHEAAWLERNVLERRLPPWNRTAGGQEVPMSIGLDPRTAELRVVYEPAGTAFGPYLGGTQVRLAISGLERALGLRYAAPRLSAGHRELAAARGVGTVDPAAAVDRVAAVLSCDPTEVAALVENLRAKRDAAAASLGFELAGRIQAEIEAVQWICAEQKVTAAGGGDFEAYGFADGGLLELTFRAGRLDDWRVRSASAQTAAGRVAATPLKWQAFAQRNAELAAALRATTR
jgi:excinuclease ABC subunit C